MTAAIELRQISRRFGRVLANDRVDLQVESGTVHAVVGENGAGKSTLLRIAYGEIQADEGEIALKGESVSRARHSPSAAIARGVGMVHQHFMLVEPLSVAENLVLGREPSRGGVLDRAAIETSVTRALERFHLDIDPSALVERLSVGQKQRVEIARVLYQGCDVLILDEPTAVLTPQEVDTLFDGLRELVAGGVTIALVTHKLDEVLAIADRATVMRRGAVVDTLQLRHAGVRDADVTAETLARAMVGRPVLLEVEKAPAQPGAAVLELSSISATRDDGSQALENLSLRVRAGEILGVAGVEGNGQTELIECVAGLRRPSAGRVRLAGVDVTAMKVAQRFERGLGHVPEDRHHRALVLDMTVEENLLLGRQGEFSSPLRIDAKRLRTYAETCIKDSDIRPDDPLAQCHGLSGGNQQKIVIARELSRPGLTCLLCAQPTRGVDIGAIEDIHRRIVAARDDGLAVLLVSAELSELRALADRMVVLHRGRITLELDAGAIADPESTTSIGLAMTGAEATG